MVNKADITEKADKAAFKWLRKKHPDWSDDRIGHLIARSHVIDQHPNWSDAEIDREVMALRAVAGKEDDGAVR